MAKLQKPLGRKRMTKEEFDISSQSGIIKLTIIKISENPSKNSCQNSLEARLRSDGSLELVIRGVSGFGAIIEGPDKIENLYFELGEIIKAIHQLKSPGQDSLF